MPSLRLWLAGMSIALSTINLANAREPGVWLAAPDSVTQHAIDYSGFFDDPQKWSVTASKISVLVITSGYLLKTPEPVIRHQLGELHSLGIKLAVSVLAMPVDKKICGNGVEGTVWPGEPAQYARQFKARGAEVDYFVMDGPLTSGHIYTGTGACQLSLEDTARHTAIAVRALREEYPNAKFVDAESPTSLPIAQWQQTLTSWLSLFKEEAGIDLYAMSMDINWLPSWIEPATMTASILHSHGVHVGIYLNARSNPNKDPGEWVSAAKRNACVVRQTNIPIDFMIVSNWNLGTVKNLPESDPTTLTAYTKWVAASGTCGP